MRIFGVDHPTKGYLTPHEMVAEGRELIAHVHALDRDNVPAAALASTKFAVGAWGTLVKDTRETARDLVLEETHGVGDEYAVPDDAGDPWRIAFDSQDGFLAGTLSLTFDVDTWRAHLWVGVRVDGVLVGVSPPGEFALDSDSIEVDFATPLAAGSHVVDIVCGYAINGVASTTITITFNDGTFFAEAVHR